MKGVERGADGEAGFLARAEGDALAVDDGVEVWDDQEEALLLFGADFTVAFGVLGGLLVLLLLGLPGGGCVGQRGVAFARAPEWPGKR